MSECCRKTQRLFELSQFALGLYIGYSYLKPKEIAKGDEDKKGPQEGAEKTKEPIITPSGKKIETTGDISDKALHPGFLDVAIGDTINAIIKYGYPVFRGAFVYLHYAGDVYVMTRFVYWLLGIFTRPRLIAFYEGFRRGIGAIGRGIRAIRGIRGAARFGPPGGNRLGGNLPSRNELLRQGNEILRQQRDAIEQGQQPQDEARDAIRENARDENTWKEFMDAYSEETERGDSPFAYFSDEGVRIVNPPNLQSFSEETTEQQPSNQALGEAMEVVNREARIISVQPEDDKGKEEMETEAPIIIANTGEKLSSGERGPMTGNINAPPRYNLIRTGGQILQSIGILPPEKVTPKELLRAGKALQKLQEEQERRNRQYIKEQEEKNLRYMDAQRAKELAKLAAELEEKRNRDIEQSNLLEREARIRRERFENLLSQLRILSNLVAIWRYSYRILQENNSDIPIEYQDESTFVYRNVLDRLRISSAMYLDVYNDIQELLQDIELSEIEKVRLEAYIDERTLEVVREQATKKVNLRNTYPSITRNISEIRRYDELSGQKNKFGELLRHLRREQKKFFKHLLEIKNVEEAKQLFNSLWLGFSLNVLKDK